MRSRRNLDNPAIEFAETHRRRNAQGMIAALILAAFFLIARLLGAGSP